MSTKLMKAVAGVLLAAGALLGVAEGASAQVSRLPVTILADYPFTRTPDLLMSEGHELFDAGRYKEAAASFERAMQLGVARPHEAARGVSRSYEKLGNWKQASRWAIIADLLEHPERAERPLRISLLLKI